MALSLTKKPRGFKIFFASLQYFTPILLGEGEPDSLESLMLLSLYCLKLLLFNTRVFLMVYYPIYTRKPKELYKTDSMHLKYLGGNSNYYLKQKAVFANGQLKGIPKTLFPIHIQLICAGNKDLFAVCFQDTVQHQGI